MPTDKAHGGAASTVGLRELLRYSNAEIDRICSQVICLPHQSLIGRLISRLDPSGCSIEYHRPVASSRSRSSSMMTGSRDGAPATSGAYLSAL